MSCINRYLIRQTMSDELGPRKSAPGHNRPYGDVADSSRSMARLTHTSHSAVSIGRPYRRRATSKLSGGLAALWLRSARPSPLSAWSSSLPSSCHSHGGRSPWSSSRAAMACIFHVPTPDDLPRNPTTRARIATDSPQSHFVNTRLECCARGEYIAFYSRPKDDAIGLIRLNQIAAG